MELSFCFPYRPVSVRFRVWLNGCAKGSALTVGYGASPQKTTKTVSTFRKLKVQGQNPSCSRQLHIRGVKNQYQHPLQVPCDPGHNIPSAPLYLFKPLCCPVPEVLSEPLPPLRQVASLGPTSWGHLSLGAAKKLRTFPKGPCAESSNNPLEFKGFYAGMLGPKMVNVYTIREHEHTKDLTSTLNRLICTCHEQPYSSYRQARMKPPRLKP